MGMSYEKKLIELILLKCFGHGKNVGGENGSKTLFRVLVCIVRGDVGKCKPPMSWKNEIELYLREKSEEGLWRMIGKDGSLSVTAIPSTGTSLVGQGIVGQCKVSLY